MMRVACLRDGGYSAGAANAKNEDREVLKQRGIPSSSWGKWATIYHYKITILHISTVISITFSARKNAHTG
jgi:hypothetical protein